MYVCVYLFIYLLFYFIYPFIFLSLFSPTHYTDIVLNEHCIARYNGSLECGLRNNKKAENDGNARQSSRPRRLFGANVYKTQRHARTNEHINKHHNTGIDNRQPEVLANVGRSFHNHVYYSSNNNNNNNNNNNYSNNNINNNNNNNNNQISVCLRTESYKLYKLRAVN